MRFLELALLLLLVSTSAGSYAANKAEVPKEVFPLMSWMEELRINSGSDAIPIKPVYREEGAFKCKNHHTQHSFGCLTPGSKDYFFCFIKSVQLKSKGQPAQTGQFDPLVCEGKNWFCRKPYPAGEVECLDREEFWRLEKMDDDKVDPRPRYLECLQDSELSDFVEKYAPGKDRASKYRYVMRSKNFTPIQSEFEARCSASKNPSHRARWFKR